MATTDPISPKNKPNSITKPLYSKANLLAALAILIVVLAAAFGIYKIVTRHHGPVPLESVAYMEKNCPIVVPVNVFVPNGSTNENAGVSVQGKITTPITTKKPSVKYTWSLSKEDKFCGIVGEWPGIKASKDVSLRPTSQTSQGGTYIDTSINSANGIHLTEFSVYARSRAGQ